MLFQAKFTPNFIYSFFGVGRSQSLNYPISPFEHVDCQNKTHHCGYPTHCHSNISSTIILHLPGLRAPRCYRLDTAAAAADATLAAPGRRAGGVTEACGWAKVTPGLLPWNFTPHPKNQRKGISYSLLVHFVVAPPPFSLYFLSLSLSLYLRDFVRPRIVICRNSITYSWVPCKYCVLIMRTKLNKIISNHKKHIETPGTQQPWLPCMASIASIALPLEYLQYFRGVGMHRPLWPCGSVARAGRAPGPSAPWRSRCGRGSEVGPPTSGSGTPKLQEPP